MACLCLLRERGTCLCCLFRLPVPLLSTIENGVECSSGVWAWLFLSSSSSSSSSSTACSPPGACPVSAKAQATLCLGICLSDGKPSTLGTRGLRSSCWQLLIVYGVIPWVHLPFLTSRLDDRPPTSPCSLQHHSPHHWHNHNSVTAIFPFPDHLRPLTVH